MWYLIFLFVMFLLGVFALYPFLICYEVKFNLLKLKGAFNLILFGKIKIQYKLRIKNGYIYVYHNKKESRYKLTDKSFNVIFFINLIKQLYFRHQLKSFDFLSNFGYLNDARVSAVATGYIQWFALMVLSKIKNNKKSAHIFVNIEPKYNQDVCSLRIKSGVYISLFDILYSLAYTAIYSWRNYERQTDNKFKQGQKD